MTPGTEHWLPTMRRLQRPVENALGTRHVMIAICNRLDLSCLAGADERRAVLEEWVEEVSKEQHDISPIEAFPPKQTLFLSVEEAESKWIPPLTESCRVEGNEIGILVPRAAASAGRLREMLLRRKGILVDHGWLPRDKEGSPRYGIILQGTLERSAPLVPHAALLREAGCYAAFLAGAAPAHIPPEHENSLCYFHEGEMESRPQGLRRVRAERGLRTVCEEGLLVARAPCVRNPDRKKFGILPCFETGELSAAEPPSRERLRLWLDCRIAVEARPNWLFLTLHVDGAQPENSRMVRGEQMRKFYRTLAELSERDRSLRFHWVTARELVNIVHAAEAGHSGNPLQFTEYRYGMPAALRKGGASSGGIAEEIAGSSAPCGPEAHAAQ